MRKIGSATAPCVDAAQREKRPSPVIQAMASVMQFCPVYRVDSTTISPLMIFWVSASISALVASDTCWVMVASP